jgi:hypothetical protein
MDILVGRIAGVRTTPFTGEGFPVDGEVDRTPELRVVLEQRA